jgi:hypothetical protein
VTDRFDTAAIRNRVLDSWAAAPVRFREDANLEEDLVLGAYRDRVLIELAQNAADAAARVGMRGRIHLSLDNSAGRGPTLIVANTGAPLDAAGVVGLCTLRASAKRDEPIGTGGDGPVGRFGVGFAAVLAVSDEPLLLSRHGGVRFSRTEAREAVRQASLNSPELAAELNRRDGRVPALRLPYPAEEAPPQGYDTAVALPLRDSGAEALVRRLLGELDDALLLALPHLAEITVELDGNARTLTAERAGRDECVITDGARTTRWRLAAAHGDLDPVLLANRPVEERDRPLWSLTWAAPVSATGDPQRLRTVPVVHAPTPTDEPLGLPALLIASLPLDPTRRHVAPGPLTDFLLDQAADAYTELIAHWPARTPGLLRLVPGPVADGALDAALRRRIADRLPDTPLLPAADGSPQPLRPRDAVFIVPCDAALIAALCEVLPGLLPAGWEGDPVPLAALGVRRMEPAALVETLAGLRREPAWWGRLYAALHTVFGHDPGAREALALLPLPLADGRTVRGARGALLPATEFDDARLTALKPLGLRIVHPAALAAGPGPYALLERLGARSAQPRVILSDPAVRAAITASHDALPQVDADAAGSGPAELAEAVLTLVRAAEPGPHDRFGLGALLLLDDRAGYTPAGDLLLPSSPLAEVVRPGAFAFADDGWVKRWGRDVLRAVGAMDAFELVRAADVLLDADGLDDELFDLDGFEDWIEDLKGLIHTGDAGLPPVLTELVAVRDLDLVAEDRWPRALELLAGPALRDAVTAPVRALPAGGRTVYLPSYTAWWLSRHPVLDGRRPADLATGGGLLTGLYDTVPDVRDPDFAIALGVRTTLPALLAAPGGPDELLDRLADPAREVTGGQLTSLYSALAELPDDRVAPPTRLRALRDGALVIADAADTAVVDSPDLLPLLGGRPYLAVAPRHALRLADLLDLNLASEMVVGAVTSAGEDQPVPDAVRELLPQAPDTYVEHEALLLDGVAEVEWRVVDGVVHASTFDGLARALAWAAGRWDRRHFVAALLGEPERAADLSAEAHFEEFLH